MLDSSSLLQDQHQTATAQHQPVTAQHQAVTAQYQAVTAQHQPVTAQHQAVTAQYQPVTAQHQAVTAQYQAVTAQPVTDQSACVLIPLVILHCTRHTTTAQIDQLSSDVNVKYHSNTTIFLNPQSQVYLLT